MLSGTEKRENPHEASLGAFLRTHESHVTLGYVGYRNGPIVSEATRRRWDAGLTSARAERRLRKRRSKLIAEPVVSNPRTRKADRAKARALKATKYQHDVYRLRQEARNGFLALGPGRCPLSRADMLIDMWRQIREGR